MPKQLPTDIAETLNALAQRDFSHVFLVACGGSLSIMHPGKYFLDRHSGPLTSDVYNGEEFVTRDPRRPQQRCHCNSVLPDGHHQGNGAGGRTCPSPGRLRDLP